MNPKLLVFYLLLILHSKNIINKCKTFIYNFKLKKLCNKKIKLIHTSENC